MVITSSSYRIMKWLVQVVLPVVGALYFLWQDIFDLPSPLTVIGTLVVIMAFLGLILRIWESVYEKQVIRGTVDLIETEEKMSYSLNFDDDPAELKNKRRAVFDVVAGR